LFNFQGKNPNPEGCTERNGICFPLATRLLIRPQGVLQSQDRIGGRVEGKGTERKTPSVEGPLKDLGGVMVKI